MGFEDGEPFVNLILRRIVQTRQAAELPADCLFDNTYVGDLIDQILLGKEQPTYSTQAAQDAEHLEHLKRGRAVQTTRFAL